MIDIILSVIIVACILYVANDIRRVNDEWVVERESDTVITYIGGKLMEVEK